MCSDFSGIEDLDNWHGKPIPKDHVEELIAQIENQIQASSKPLQAALPNEDAAPVDPSPIYLQSPPEYKSVDKVILLYRLISSKQIIYLVCFGLPSLFIKSCLCADLYQESLWCCPKEDGRCQPAYCGSGWRYQKFDFL